MSRLPLTTALATALVFAVGPVGFVAPGVALADSPTTSVTGLSLGERGPAVKQVQDALIAAGVPVVGGADGYFGQMTVAALRSFQSAQGLEVTGVVDEATAARLGLIDSSARSTHVTASWTSDFSGLELGVVGPRVRALQEALTAAGVPGVGGADGVFGPMTAQAISTFQQQRGLEVTGRVDAPTAAALGGSVRGSGPAATSAPAPDPAVNPAVNPVVGLRIGARGPAVAQVQQALKDAGLRFAGGVDGIFGMATSNALSQFQHSKGLPVTGEVDAATAAALSAPGSIAAASPAAPGTTGATRALAGLAPGTIGNNVRALQQALLAAGITFPGGADGIFGPATANAVKQFQTSRGLPATGRVDQPTADALTSGAPAAPSTPSPSTSPSTSPSASPSGLAGFAAFGERGDRVRALQQALIDTGIAVPGGADGIFGAQTAGAVMNFQRREGLVVTGVVDAATASLLGLVGAAPPPPPSTAGITLDYFPVQGTCHFADTWHAPRGGGRLHEGVDIIAPEGRYIYAVTSGTISHVYHDRPGSLTGNGLRLVLPDGTYFFYAHLQAVADGITVGTKVAAGQIIGYNGTTGNAGIPHLHFEVHPKGGAAVNPYPLVKAIDGCSKTDPPRQP
jgi:peptidoglycan hydrolase-like protein with peptidoglycan-binding domain